MSHVRLLNVTVALDPSQVICVHRFTSVSCIAPEVNGKPVYIADIYAVLQDTHDIPRDTAADRFLRATYATLMKLSRFPMWRDCSLSLFLSHPPFLFLSVSFSLSPLSPFLHIFVRDSTVRLYLLRCVRARVRVRPSIRDIFQSL